jgi:hypothetical protein
MKEGVLEYGYPRLARTSVELQCCKRLVRLKPSHLSVAVTARSRRRLLSSQLGTCMQLLCHTFPFHPPEGLDVYENSDNTLVNESGHLLCPTCAPLFPISHSAIVACMPRCSLADHFLWYCSVAPRRRTIARLRNDRRAPRSHSSSRIWGAPGIVPPTVLRVHSVLPQKLARLYRSIFLRPCAASQAGLNFFFFALC